MVLSQKVFATSQPTRKTRSRKAADRPPKPYPDFPPYAHPLGYWSKMILGTIHHFGRWGRRVNGKLVRVADDGWKEALELYKVQADDLHAGRTPRPTGDGLTVADLCNRFLTAKQRQLDAGEISARMFAEYRATTDRLVGAFGKPRRVDDLAPEDFGALRAGMAKQFGPVRLGNEVQRVRTVFKFALDNGLTEKVVRYGSEFQKPSKRVLRRHRAAASKKTFTADELRGLIDAAGTPLRAMVLLGINCGFGNHDCGTAPLSALDLDGGWAEFPRPKTGITRRCPLWPETAATLREAIAGRPERRDEAAAGLFVIRDEARERLGRGRVSNGRQPRVWEAAPAAAVPGVRQGQRHQGRQVQLRLEAERRAAVDNDSPERRGAFTRCGTPSAPWRM